MRITLAEIVERWGLSKATVYRNIQLGKINKGEDGLIDVANVVQLWGEPNARRIKKKSKNESKTVEIDNDTNEREKLLLSQIKQLEQQVQQANERETWLKQQFEQAQKQVEQAQERVKLLEHKPSQATPPPPPKNGLFNKLVKAITG